MNTFDTTTERLITRHWPQMMPKPISKAQQEQYREHIKALLKQHNACLVVHYYVDDQLQQLARETGGIVADSLLMAEFGRKSPCDTLVVCGVRFMGETAKILSPEKKILMPTLEATCSLDLGCPADQFKAFRAQHPDRTAVVYVNTSAAVKALADWTVTSRNSLEIVRHLHEQGQKILWAPDKHLGQYIQNETGADMLLWNSACVVHDEFKSLLIEDLKAQYPDAALLAHPESPASVVKMADVIGSTSKLLEATHTLPNQTFIVATDQGIIAEMRRLSPNKTFIVAPTAGSGATCRSCGHCPWMAQNALANLAQTLTEQTNEIHLSDELIAKAAIPLQRMMNFKL